MGLDNLGNTCYMNAVIQCISNALPLVRFFLEGHHTDCVRRQQQAAATSSTGCSATQRERGALALAFGKLLEERCSAASKSSVCPSEVKVAVGQVEERFRGNTQHDAQEFLRFLLDGLHQDLNRVTSKAAYQEMEEMEGESEATCADRMWKYDRSLEDSLIRDVFVGQLRSRVTCASCRHVSTTFDSFWDLSLPIRKGVERQEVSLLSCLGAFTEKEVLQVEEAFNCAKCKTRGGCSKQISLYRLPQVLVVHLKRFSFTNLRRTKLTTPVHIPTKGLDVSSHTAVSAATGGGQGPGKNCIYDLIGVCNHEGGAEAGHYTADCKNFDSGEWYKFNDSEVTKIKDMRVDGSAAYLLLYQKRGSSDEAPVAHASRRTSSAARPVWPERQPPHSRRGSSQSRCSGRSSSSTRPIPGLKKGHQDLRGKK